MSDFTVKSINLSTPIEQHLEMINVRLGRFCFENSRLRKRKMIQFVLEKHLDPNSENPDNLVELQMQEKVKDDDEWNVWYKRCIVENTK